MGSKEQALQVTASLILEKYNKEHKRYSFY